MAQKKKLHYPFFKIFGTLNLDLYLCFWLKSAFLRNYVLYLCFLKNIDFFEIFWKNEIAFWKSAIYSNYDNFLFECWIQLQNRTWIMILSSNFSKNFEFWKKRLNSFLFKKNFLKCPYLLENFTRWRKKLLKNLSYRRY